MTNESEAVVRRWFDEVWNQRRPEAVDELMAEDGVCHGEMGPVIGRDGFCAKLYDPLVAAFPDIRVVVEDAVAQGDRVAVRWAAHGTHAGAGMGLVATGRRVTFRGLTWVRVEGGRMREGWQFSDMTEVIRGLASLPA